MPNFLRRAAVAVAAVAASMAAVSVPAAYASTTQAADSECNGLPVVYLVHGIAQGPTAAHPQLSQSPELSSFVTDLSDTDDTSFIRQPVIYPAASRLNLVATWDTYMNDGERNLQSAITYGNDRTCRGDEHIALVGYSMGAWVIDKWLQQHRNEWSEVTAVTLFGDPCWTSSGGNEGLTRLFLGSYGCPPGKDYPFPAARSSVPFPVLSYTLNKDPVSGYGFHGGQPSLPPNVFANREKQLAAAIACISPVFCPHLDYQNGWIGAVDVQDGANLVADIFAEYGS